MKVARARVRGLVSGWKALVRSHSNYQCLWPTLTVVAPLGPREVELFNKMTYKLYETFWGKGVQTLDAFSARLEEAIPELICINPANTEPPPLDDTGDSPPLDDRGMPSSGVEEETPPEATCEMRSINLTSTLGWTPAHNQSRMHPHILERQEYVDLVNYLDDTKNVNILVGGQPGIG